MRPILSAGHFYFAHTLYKCAANLVSTLALALPFKGRAEMKGIHMPRNEKQSTATVYPALHALSAGFEQVLAAMDLLNAFQLRKGDLFEDCRSLLQEAAAGARFRVVEALAELELENWSQSEVEAKSPERKALRSERRRKQATKKATTNTPAPKRKTPSKTARSEKAV